jgi:transglutaminase-like putative cysteine protease
MMNLERVFRLSHFLTLALACAAYGYAVRPHLPEVGYGIVPVLLVLLLAYRIDGRRGLSFRMSAVFAIVIAAAAGLWMASVFTDPAQREQEAVQQVARLLPYGGCVLLVLMLAKLFRPKRADDYLSLLAIAFILVALACTLDSDFLFGVLLAAYLVCAVWCLALFHVYRSAETPQPAAVVPGRAWGFWRCGRQMLLLTPLAVVGFLLTPRQAGSVADTPLLAQNAYQTGVGEAVMDLNRSGSLHLDRSVAFEVAAEDAAGRPKLDLSAGQRWRGVALNYYEAGRWFNQGVLVEPRRAELPPRGRQPSGATPRDELTDLGPEQYFLTFTFPQQAPRRVLLAEPVLLAEGERRVNVAFFGRPGYRPAAYRLDMEVQRPAVTRGQTASYLQVTIPTPEPDLSSPLPPGSDVETTPLRDAPALPGLRAWTDDLLDRLVRAGRLDEDDLRRQPNGWLQFARHEKVARALEAYLAASGDYAYSLQFARSNLRIDPTLDFLCNVKQGHCERYAGALALMLRTQGVAARVVIGFRGAESQGDGRYLVRHSEAHSWVEILVPREGGRWHWLTLDPTPGEDVAASGAWWARWWHGVEENGGRMWSNFVLEYAAEQRQRLLREAWQRVLAVGSDPRVWLSMIVVLCLALLVLYRRRLVAPKPLAMEATIYRRLLDIVARRWRLKPEPAQTPQEFAALVCEHLRSAAATAALAELPMRVARLYYRVRYAQQPLDRDEQAEIEQRLAELEAGPAC